MRPANNLNIESNNSKNYIILHFNRSTLCPLIKKPGIFDYANISIEKQLDIKL